MAITTLGMLTAIFYHTRLPKYAIEDAGDYKKHLAENSEAISDSQHKFLYNKKGEACLEFTASLKNGYTMKNPTWIGCTWYQGNSIDEEGYVVDIPVQSPVDLTFDIDEFNSLGGAINSATGKKMTVHFAWNDAKKDGV